jgi:protoheme ferro-lyase
MTGQATSEAIYTQVVKPLPLPERLKLATMILNDIPPRAVVDYSEEWTEEDMRDFTAASWAYITKKLDEEEQDARL